MRYCGLRCSKKPRCKEINRLNRNWIYICKWKNISVHTHLFVCIYRRIKMSLLSPRYFLMQSKERWYLLMTKVTAKREKMISRYICIASGDRVDGNFLTRHVAGATDVYQATAVITGNHRIDRDAVSPRALHLARLRGTIDNRSGVNWFMGLSRSWTLMRFSLGASDMSISTYITHFRTNK